MASFDKKLIQIDGKTVNSINLSVITNGSHFCLSKDP